MKLTDNINTLIPIFYILNSLSPSILKIIDQNINVVIIIIAIGLILITSYHVYLNTLRKKYFVKMEGYVSCLSSPYYGMNIQYEFSDEMKSIMNLLVDKIKNKYCIIKNKKCNIHHNKNNDENINENSDIKNLNAIKNKYFNNIPLKDNIMIDDNIFIEITSHNIRPEKCEMPVLELSKITLTLHSNMNILDDFIKNNVLKYKELLNKKIKKNEIKVFTYVKNEIVDDEKRIPQNHFIFSEKILSNDEDIYNFETFEHIFNDNVNLIKSNIEKLNDLEFNKKFGFKNKLCYLFYGGYGTGKTSFITAIANEYKRHILEIPFSRIKTNDEFDKLLNITFINGTKINKNELIIVFDEIDRNNAIICSNDITNDNDDSYNKNNDNNDNGKDCDVNKSHKITNKNDHDRIDDKLNMSFVLSKLDGLGNYNGLIIIATTNNIDKIHPALYRDMRMTKIHFTHMTKKNITDLCEKYFETKLNEDEIDKLPDINDCVSGATCKMLLKNYHDNLDKFLEKLSELKK